jgi:PHD/YefM family antitoxin component YafN of YafNO toxin-antitoxin module
MKSVTSAEFQRNFGLWKRKALVEPVAILVHGRESVILVSASAYRTLLKLSAVVEDAISKVEGAAPEKAAELDAEDIDALRRMTLSDGGGSAEPTEDEMDEEDVDIDALRRLMLDEE